jgi:NarL family two-component system response regulator LiaR
MIVDDHAMVRGGLERFLSVYDDFELVGEAGTGAEAIEIFQLQKPDVILMDLVMPDIDGVQATRRILAEAPGTRVIALTSFQDRDLVEQVLKAGAISYLLKNISAEDLAQAIRSAYAGRTTLAPEAMHAMMQSTEGKSGLEVKLTSRELEVLELIAEGLSNPEIGERLSITLATVKFHVSVIFSKIGAANRAEAVSLALRNHYIDKS